MQPWTEAIDPAAIPDEVIIRERDKRNAARRKNPGGDRIWRQHSETSRACRCAECTRKRDLKWAEQRKALAGSA